MRGHTHTIPTAVKIARGNPGKRPLPKNEPAPRLGLPSCPDEFDEEHRRVWDTIGSRLVRLGIMTENDGEALADLVRSELRQREVDRKIRGTAPVVEGKGGPVKNPLWAVAIELLRERRAQHEKFGMTPSSRARLTAIDPKHADPLEDAVN